MELIIIDSFIFSGISVWLADDCDDDGDGAFDDSPCLSDEQADKKSISASMVASAYWNDFKRTSPPF
ncbi:hypothetical protein [Cohnella rhizosphaerae]|uniref:Uncharacterized protein n=1 Tax=Cohnella rhizosphaerae TaxID=1457232 RepID=A0A9X4KYE3_9BACL|nr:hypothetical protein [Cohnella rhizosphaerae]MDG0813606.1 hypothetical protein [Cohnella rhizosphaerae]